MSQPPVTEYPPVYKAQQPQQVPLQQVPQSYPQDPQQYPQQYPQNPQVPQQQLPPCPPHAFQKTGRWDIFDIITCIFCCPFNFCCCPPGYYFPFSIGDREERCAKCGLIQ